MKLNKSCYVVHPIDPETHVKSKKKNKGILNSYILDIPKNNKHKAKSQIQYSGWIKNISDTKKCLHNSVDIFHGNYVPFHSIECVVWFACSRRESNEYYISSKPILWRKKQNHTEIMQVADLVSHAFTSDCGTNYFNCMSHWFIPPFFCEWLRNLYKTLTPPTINFGKTSCIHWWLIFTNYGLVNRWPISTTVTCDCTNRISIWIYGNEAQFNLFPRGNSFPGNMIDS